MLLVMIDNYDSFTYNLVHLFAEFHVDIQVFRHDEVEPQEVQKLKPDWLCISPGPRDPAHAGVSRMMVERFAGDLPILGVCLGMQVINEVYGGRTVRAPLPVHGKSSLVHHNGEGLFAGLPSPFRVARYHSLQALVNPRELDVVARAEDGVVMGLRHRSLPIWGVQFHPESFFSDCGMELAVHFLGLSADFPRWDVRTIPAHPGRFPRWEGRKPFQIEESYADTTDPAATRQE